MTSIIKVDQIQNAAGTGSIDHGRILSKDDGLVIRQTSRQHYTPTITTASTSFIDGPSFTFTDIQPDSDLDLYIRLPMRNDIDSWGGLYMALWHTIDGGTTWRSMGTTGFDMMNVAGAIIMTYTNKFLLPSEEIGLSTAGSITFKVRLRPYSGTLILNGSHDINGGGDTNQNSYSDHFWTSLTLTEYASL